MSLLLEKTRAKLFWIIDALQGGVIKKHYNDIIKSIEDTDKVSSNNKLYSLLQHATSTVPYYKNYSKLSIKNFPIVDKTVMRDSGLFLSDKFIQSERIAAVTSGSTGTPFKVYQDINKKKRNTADTIYFAKKAGFSIGNRLIYLKIWSENNRKSFISRWMQNIEPIDVIKLDDNQFKYLIKKLESSNSTFGFLGYSSALELLTRYLEKTKTGKIKASVRTVISMSESLTEYTKTTLTKFFSAQVVSRYSNIENGIIAQQETNGKHQFLINTASYFVEILKFNSDNPAKDGELGRIVVTDLYNYAMPMIRYDTGDVGSFMLNNKNYLEKIEGRKLDQIYGTDGHLISPYIVYKNMWQYTDIIQYQLIQYGKKDYLFKINTDVTFTKEAQLIKEFKMYLGDDANFNLEYVDEIPLLSSGKRKKIVNTFHKK